MNYKLSAMEYIRQGGFTDPKMNGAYAFGCEAEVERLTPLLEEKDNSLKECREFIAGCIAGKYTLQSAQKLLTKLQSIK